MTVQGATIERFQGRPEMNDLGRRDRDLLAWWTEEDIAKVKELAQAILHARQRTAELEKRQRDIRFKLDQARTREAEAKERRRRVALGELPEGSDLPAMGSSEEAERFRLDAIGAGLEAVAEEEKDFQHSLRGHCFAAQERATRVLYSEYETRARALADVYRLLRGAHDFREQAGIGVLLQPSIWNQVVLPAEPTLASGARTYQEVFSASFILHGLSESQTPASVGMATQLKVGIEKLLPPGVSVDLNRPAPKPGWMK